MKKRTRFRQYNRGQVLAFPPNPEEWLPEGDLAYFIDEVVGTLDLGAIYANDDNARGGQPPEELRFKQSRLKKIQQAKQALEQEARQEQAEQAAKSNLKGQLPKRISADSGYFSEDNCTLLESQHVDVFKELCFYI